MSFDEEEDDPGARNAGKKNSIPLPLPVLLNRRDIRDRGRLPPADWTVGSLGTYPLAQSPARFKASEAVVPIDAISVELEDAVDGSTSKEKGRSGIREAVGEGGEVDVGEDVGDVEVVLVPAVTRSRV